MAHKKRQDAAPVAHADKTCASCGRRIEWRAKWAANWDDVRYCSDACRRRGVTAADLALEADILKHLPMTVGESEPERRAARRLVAKGELLIFQNGHVVDPSTAKGVFQVRRA
jgi:hypothetical protein